MLWGETEFNQIYYVSKEGYLFIPNVGQVFVNGLNLSKLEIKLFKLMNKVYSSLNPSNGSPTTFLDVSLGGLALRPTRIVVLGEIAQPGAYAVKSSTTLFSSIYYFNGPSVDGSLRQIKLIRKGKEISNIDYYNYLLEGKTTGDSRLQKDDIIFIPKRGKTVKLFGEIRRPAIYELKDNEDLNDLIKIAGGLLPTTFMNRVQIKRILPSSEEILGGARTIIDFNLNELKNDSDFELFDGDEIEFFEIYDGLYNTVAIDGAILRPGNYDLGTSELYISDLIEKADGLSGEAYTRRAELTRMNSDLTKSLTVVNLDMILKGLSDDIMLKSNDSLYINRNSDLTKMDRVFIMGHVKYPGSKEFLDGMTISDLIFKGGGFQDRSHLSKTYLDKADFFRYNFTDLKYESFSFRLDSVLLGKGYANFKLIMGDSIKVYSAKEIKGNIFNEVELAGYVKNPGFYTYYKGMKVSELLFKGSGINDPEFSSLIFKGRFDIIRKNESIGQDSLMSYQLLQVIDSTNNIDPVLLGGDRIVLYSKNFFYQSPKVKISGDVKTPGVYNLYKDMKLADLILESGGLKSEIYHFKADVYRIDSKNESPDKYAKEYSFSLLNEEVNYTKKFLFGRESNSGFSFSLKAGDIVQIRRSPINKERSMVNISGKVAFPGDYVLLSANEKVSDIIYRAGGLNKDAYPEASKFKRGRSVSICLFQAIKESQVKTKLFSISWRFNYYRFISKHSYSFGGGKKSWKLCIY